MKSYQKWILISISILIFWMIISWIFQWDLLEFTNMTFLSGLIGLITGGILLVVRSGFISLFISGFRKISFGLSSKSRAMKRTNTRIKNDAFIQGFKQRLTYWMTRVVLSFSVLSMVLAGLGLIYYYS